MNKNMARMRAQLKRGRYGYEYGNSSCAGDFDRLCVSIGSPNDEKGMCGEKEMCGSCSGHCGGGCSATARIDKMIADADAAVASAK